MARGVGYGGALWLVAAVVLGSCGKPPPAPTTLPSLKPPTTASRPVRPPDTRPAPTADRADAIVPSPGERQDGWLVIEQIRRSKRRAYATGKLVYQNKIVVDTQNVRQLLLDMRRLSVDPSRRVILVLDGQGIELSAGLGPVLRFRRSQAGSWSLVREP